MPVAATLVIAVLICWLTIWAELKFRESWRRKTVVACALLALTVFAFAEISWKLDLQTAKRHIAELEERIAPRTLTEAQRTGLLSHLPGGNNRPITFSVPVGDGEAVVYGEQLMVVFKSRGWNVRLTQHTGRVKPQGLFVVVGKNQARTPENVKIFNAFVDAGLHVHFGEDENVPPDHFEIHVGRKS